MSPRDLDQILTTDVCSQISCSDLMRATKQLLKQQILKQKACVDGVSIDITFSETGNGGLRYWFTCPICEKRCEVIYKHPLTQNIGCRTCLGLKYKSQVVKKI